MTTEEYILKKLENLSEEEQKNSDEIVESLGTWATPQEVADYMGKHINTVYTWQKEGILISKRAGRAIRIYSASLVFLLDE